jgi:hypothetical protein
VELSDGASWYVEISDGAPWYVELSDGAPWYVELSVDVLALNLLFLFRLIV